MLGIWSGQRGQFKMAVIKTVPKKILDKLDAGINVTDSVIRGDAINLSHRFIGVQDTSEVFYTVPANKKLIVFLVYSTAKDFINIFAVLECRNSEGSVLWRIDEDFALNVNFLDGVVFILGAGSSFRHIYNNNDSQGNSTFSVLGVLVDE